MHGHWAGCHIFADAELLLRAFSWLQLAAFIFIFCIPRWCKNCCILILVSTYQLNTFCTIFAVFCIRPLLQCLPLRSSTVSAHGNPCPYGCSKIHGLMWVRFNTGRGKEACKASCKARHSWTQTAFGNSKPPNTAIRRHLHLVQEAVANTAIWSHKRCVSRCFKV